MAITQKVTLDEEEVYTALAAYLKNKHSIDIHDEANLIFPSASEASNNVKYIEINY